MFEVSAPPRRRVNPIRHPREGEGLSQIAVEQTGGIDASLRWHDVVSTRLHLRVHPTRHSRPSAGCLQQPLRINCIFDAGGSPVIRRLQLDSRLRGNDDHGRKA